MNIRKANLSDLEGIRSLLNEESERAISIDYLKSWYWENPSNSHSVIVCEENDRILGIASTNNFKLTIDGDEKLVAFPQKVFTSNEIRSKGYFSKLYFENEKDNLANNKVDCFLTFTNKMSTPIFLSKFGYKRGISPSITLLPTIPFVLGSTFGTVQEVSDLNNGFLSNKNLVQTTNSILKDGNYLNWRYRKELNTKGLAFKKLKIEIDGQLAGYAVIKKVFRMNIPFYYVAEIITHEQGHIPSIIRAARRYASSKGAFGIMLMNNALIENAIRQYGLKLQAANKLNFLVKGKSPIETERLAKTEFNFTFGDLDFI